MKTNYIYFEIKYTFRKYKYHILGGCILLFSIIYFLFFREIRDIHVQATHINIDENKNVMTDFQYDFYLRSKNKISNIDFKIKFDFDIPEDIKDKKEYEKFLHDFAIDKFISCSESKKCEIVGKNEEVKNVFLNMIDSIYSYGKISEDMKKNIEIDIEQDMAGNAPLTVLDGAQPGDVFDDISPGDTFGSVSNDMIGQNNFGNGGNVFGIGVSQIEDGNKKINCFLSEYKNHPDCYKTPKMDIKINSIRVSFVVNLLNNKKDTGTFVIPLQNSYIKIKGDS